MVEYTDDGIPKRELTLQFQPLAAAGESDVDTPSVAAGTEIKLYAETIKEIFQKEPTFIPIQRGPNNHFKGDETLVNDTMKAKHKWEVTAWVYSEKSGKNSLDDSILEYDNMGNFKGTATLDESKTDSFEAEDRPDTIQADEFGTYYPLGDTGIKYDSEYVETTDGIILTRGVDYEMDYSKGEIKFLDSGNISTATQTTSFGPVDLGTQTIITDDFKIKYTFDAEAQNIAKLVRRMSQLGNPLVMRLDKQDISLEGDAEQLDSHAYLVMPKKVAINSKSEKPDEYKVELELRKSTVDR